MRRTVILFVGLSLLALVACEKRGPGTNIGPAGPTAANGTMSSAIPAATTAAAVGAPATLSTAATAIKLTPENTKIEFVGSKNGGQHNGSFQKFAGTLELKGNDATTAHVVVEIETESITTDTPQLTGHLKSPAFFEVKKYPKATFVSTAIKRNAGIGGPTHTVTGDLTMHGITKSISFPAMVSATADAVSLTSEFTINRQDYAITYGPGMVHDQVVIKLSIKAPRK